MNEFNNKLSQLNEEGLKDLYIKLFAMENIPFGCFDAIIERLESLTGLEETELFIDSVE